MQPGKAGGAAWMKMGESTGKVKNSLPGIPTEIQRTDLNKNKEEKKET